MLEHTGYPYKANQRAVHLRNHLSYNRDFRYNYGLPESSTSIKHITYSNKSISILREHDVLSVIDNAFHPTASDIFDVRPSDDVFKDILQSS
ncbi:hypothetical protein GCK32_021795 [Trichostrongylus colubriformis]|uniref:Uncharacterized protein n=1 Tax=Trichostrongylus colubriformis TaxID=6319 RepID=A0AAN8FR19_TRICO